VFIPVYHTLSCPQAACNPIYTFIEYLIENKMLLRIFEKFLIYQYVFHLTSKIIPTQEFASKDTTINCH
jgi:hypothetical protein